MRSLGAVSLLVLALTSCKSPPPTGAFWPTTSDPPGPPAVANPTGKTRFAITPRAGTAALPCDRTGSTAIHGTVTDVVITDDGGCYFIGDVGPGRYPLAMFFAEGVGGADVTVSAGQRTTIDAAVRLVD